MNDDASLPMVEIELDRNLWNRCYSVHTLVVVGSREEDGEYNLAPKHMAMPMGFSPYFGFMGTPRKSTYRNVEREGVFTVSIPTPEQVVTSSLAASQREEDDSKPVIHSLPTVPARKIDGYFLEDAYFHLECRLDQIAGKFGEWEMLVGEVVAAYVHDEALRRSGEDEEGGGRIYEAPLLAYLHPDRFSVIRESNAFPFPRNFKR